MGSTAVGVFGGSGYSGRELTRLLRQHPAVRVSFVAADAQAGERLDGEGGEGGPRYCDVATGLERASECAVVFTATPAGASRELAPVLLGKGCRLIDLSGAFRLTDAMAQKQYYGFERGTEGPAPVYGLSELFADEIARATLVANPGCYPTAAILSLAPFVRAGVVDPASLIIDAASGVTGAGRRGDVAYSFAEVAGDFRAYKVLGHQHAPEITEVLGRLAPGVRSTFTAHLLPVSRGILCTSYATIIRSMDTKDLLAIARDAYYDAPFITVADRPELVSLRAVVGTNRCLFSLAAEPEIGGRLVVVAAIDNLLKGAAGQAVQNLNLMFGWPAHAGLVPATVWS